jgi:hypothetical protein
MLTGRIRTPVDRALLGVALLSLQEKLLAFAAAELADGTGVTSHGVVLFLLGATRGDA